MVAAQNWWKDDPVAPANDPSFTGYIPGTPKPTKPADPPSGYEWTNGPGSTLRPISGGPADKGGDGNDLMSDAIKGLGVDELLDNVKKARAAVKGGYATGITGSVLGRIPGTSAADFRGYIDAIQGGIILEKMQALKDASKTGASGLGALSEKEGERLAASVASIKPNMSDDALQDSLNAIEKHANFLRAVQDGKDPRDPAVMKAYGLTPSDTNASQDRKEQTGLATPAAAATPSGGDGGNNEAAKIGVSELTADQKKAYAGFWDQNPNPTPEKLKGFLSSIGINNVTNAEDIIKGAKSGGGYSTTHLETDYKTKVAQQAKQDEELHGKSPVTDLAVQGATLGLSDEAAGVGNALANAVTSPFTSETFDPVTSYRLGRDAERLRIDNARQQLGYGGTAIELTTGLASGGPAALEFIAPREAAVAAGKAGAVGGALSGFGSGEGAQDSTVNAAGGAVIGGALGRYGPALIGKAGKLLPKRFRPPQGMAADVAEAAQAEGVDLIRPMVDPSAVSDFGALESNVYSQPIIRGAQGRIAGQIEDRVGALAPGGEALEPGAAGEKLQLAGNRYITRSRGIKNRLYDRAEALGGSTPVNGKEAVAQIDAELADLSSAPETNAGQIKFLEGLKSDFGRPQTVGSIRNIRTSLRGEISRQNLTLTQAEARALRVMDAAKRDIQRDAPSAAANAYARADAFNTERQIMVDDIKKSILGKRDEPLDPQQAFAKIKSLASPGGNGRRLSAIMRHLEPDERQDIAATVAQSLGRRSPDESFSTALFVSQARKLSPSARRTIFGPDGAQSIDNLRLLARKLEEAGKDINRSRSATVLERQGLRMAARSFIATLAGMGGTAAMTGSAGIGIAGGAVAGGAMMASAGRRVLSARAMVNPRVSRWLAEAADVSTERQAKEATRKLGVIIGREPALARELQPIYDSLQQRLTMPLAANSQPEGNDDDR